MSIDYMEKMAREYNEKLRFGGSSGYLHNAIGIVERQLDIIVAASYAYKANKSLTYLECLKRKSLFGLNKLYGQSVVPECKDKATFCGNGYYNTLVNLEIELFINLDYLIESGQDAAAILDTETRALGVMGLIH